MLFKYFKTLNWKYIIKLWNNDRENLHISNFKALLTVKKLSKLKSISHAPDALSKRHLSKCITTRTRSNFGNFDFFAFRPFTQQIIIRNSKMFQPKYNSIGFVRSDLKVYIGQSLKICSLNNKHES